MIWLLLGALVLFAAGVGGVVMFRRADEFSGTELVGVIVMFSAFIGFLICVAIAIITPASRGHAETVCARMAVQLERDTRFVTYGAFDWDCITPSGDGWVSIDRVIKAEGVD